MITEQLREELIQAAIDVRDRAYAGYSNYHVGAALLCPDGVIVTGNVGVTLFRLPSVSNSNCTVFPLLSVMAKMKGKLSQTSALKASPPIGGVIRNPPGSPLA